MPHYNPYKAQHPIPDNIGVFWISDYECWAGRSMEECIQASMKEFGVTREEAYEEAAAYEVPRDGWDEKCPTDEDDEIVYKPREKGQRGSLREVDWDKTKWCHLREMVAAHDTFPAFIGGRE